jgi:hypothetical protein
MVIIDEGLPDMDVPALASSLGRGGLKSSIPILVYSPNFWHESEQAAAMRAGAWDIIKEPVRSNLVVAKLRRLLEIKQLIEATEEGSLSDAATGLFNLAGMLRMLRVMGSAARRHGASLTCVVLGPTEVPETGSLEALRERAARLWGEGIRESDVCGWVDSSELGIVSAGIVELTDRFVEDTAAEATQVAPMATRIAGLSGIAVARSALREAREAGGGIRIAELT